MEDFTDLAHFDIYVCGPFMMAKTAKEKLIEEKKKQSQNRCLPMLLHTYKENIKSQIINPAFFYYFNMSKGNQVTSTPA